MGFAYILTGINILVSGLLSIYCDMPNFKIAFFFMFCICLANFVGMVYYSKRSNNVEKEI